MTAFLDTDILIDCLRGVPAAQGWLTSAALCAILDQQPWLTTGPSTVLGRPDPLEEIDQSEWT